MAKHCGPLARIEEVMWEKTLQSTSLASDTNLYTSPIPAKVFYIARYTHKLFFDPALKSLVQACKIQNPHASKPQMARKSLRKFVRNKMCVDKSPKKGVEISQCMQFHLQRN